MRKAILAATLRGVVSCYTQSVPVEVKQAIRESIKASDTDGQHEEGGIWGITTAGKLVVIPAKSGKSVQCGDGVKVYITPGEAANPALDADLATVLGEWHVHPSGCNFIQPPSAADIETAIEAINLVIGARDKVVYFYNPREITGTEKLKSFLK